MSKRHKKKIKHPICVLQVKSDELTPFTPQVGRVTNVSFMVTTFFCALPCISKCIFLPKEKKKSDKRKVEMRNRLKSIHILLVKEDRKYQRVAYISHPFWGF